MTHTWDDAYRWMLEWGGEVERAHTLGLSPVMFSELEGITALWDEKDSGYCYTLLDQPGAGTSFAKMYVELGGEIGPYLGKRGLTLIAPPGGSPVPKGPLDGSIWGWVEPGQAAPPVNLDCKVEKQDGSVYGFGGGQPICMSCRHRENNAPGITQCGLKSRFFGLAYTGGCICLDFAPTEEVAEHQQRCIVERDSEPHPPGTAVKPLGSDPLCFHCAHQHGGNLPWCDQNIDRPSNDDILYEPKDCGYFESRHTKKCDCSCPSECDQLRAENETLRAELLDALRELRGR